MDLIFTVRINDLINMLETDIDDHYSESVNVNATTPLKRRPYGYSHDTIGRFSEHSIHSAYRLGGYRTCGKCKFKYSSILMQQLEFVENAMRFAFCAFRNNEGTTKMNSLS